MKIKYLSILILTVFSIVEAAIPFEKGNVTIRTLNGDRRTGIWIPGLWKDAEGKLQCKASFSTQCGGVKELELEFTTSSEIPELLNLEFALQNIEGEYFWDGNAEHDIPAEGIEKTGLLDTFPLAALWTSGKPAVALGIGPDTPTSFLQRGVVDKRFFYRTKVVVDAKKAQRLKFIQFEFTPDYGWRSAAQLYYDAYPTFFSPKPDIDQRIFGVGGMSTSAHMQRGLELHNCRTVQMDWEWCLPSSWKVSGDWYPHPEYWLQNSFAYSNYYKIRQPKECDYSEFMAVQARRFEVCAPAFAQFYYVLVKDAHEKFVSRYPETVNSFKYKSGMWSDAVNKGHTYLTFAPGSGLFRELSKRLELAAENYPISGFAFDMSNHAVDFTSDSQLRHAVARSFRDDGTIYTPDEIATLEFARFAHTLKRGDLRMAVYMNMAISYFTPFAVFEADGIMFEGSPEVNVRNLPVLRLMAGRKPMTFWNALGLRNSGIVMENLTRQERLKEIDGLATYTLLKGLQFGITPQNWALWHGDRKFFTPHIKYLTSLVRAGWNPAPGIKASAPELWLGRFGSGLDTLITISNPTREEIKSKFELNSVICGVDAAIPVSNVEEPLACELNGSITSFELYLPAKEYRVLRVFNWQGPQGKILVTATSAGDYEFSVSDAGTLQGNSIDPFASRRISPVFENDKFQLCFDKERTLRLSSVPDTLILGDVKAIAEFYPADAHPKLRVGTGKNAENLALMFRLYYQTIAGAKKYSGTTFTREPGFVEGTYAEVRDTPASPRIILIGTPEDFPELALTPSETAAPGGFLKQISSEMLWVGGVGDNELRKAAYHCFALMDDINDK